MITPQDAAIKKEKLEKVFEAHLKKLKDSGLDISAFKFNLEYYDTFNDSMEYENTYNIIVRYLESQTAEYLNENPVFRDHMTYEKIKEYIDDWANSLSVEETLSDEEIEKDTIEAKLYFINVLEEYYMTRTNPESFISFTFDDLKKITKKGRAYRRVHGEKVLGKKSIISSMNFRALYDFEDRLGKFERDGDLTEDNPIIDVYHKYKKL